MYQMFHFFLKKCLGPEISLGLTCPDLSSGWTCIMAGLVSGPDVYQGSRQEMSRAVSILWQKVSKSLGLKVSDLFRDRKCLGASFQNYPTGQNEPKFHILFHKKAHRRTIIDVLWLVALAHKKRGGGSFYFERKDLDLIFY
jgi:hypothetical protein